MTLCSKQQHLFTFFLCFSNPCAFNTFFATKRLSKSLLGRGLKIVRHQIDTIRFYIFFHCLLGHTHVFRSSEFCNLSTVYTQLLIWRKKFRTAHEKERKSQCWKFGVNFWNVVNVSLDCYCCKKYFQFYFFQFLPQGRNSKWGKAHKSFLLNAEKGYPSIRLIPL